MLIDELIAREKDSNSGMERILEYVALAIRCANTLQHQGVTIDEIAELQFLSLRTVEYFYDKWIENRKLSNLEVAKIILEDFSYVVHK